MDVHLDFFYLAVNKLITNKTQNFLKELNIVASLNIS